MYKYVLESVENIHLFSIVSLLIFFTFFTLHLIVALRKDKSEMEACSSIPMNDGVIDELNNK